MAFNFTKAVKKAFSGKDEVDRILDLPITKLRLELKAQFQEKKFTQEQFEAFVEKLAKVDDLGTQLDFAKNAVEKKEVESEIDIELNSPAKQLLWAAVITRLMDAATEGPVAQTRLWKQLQGTIGVHNECIIVSKMLSSALQNDDVTFEVARGTNVPTQVSDS